MITLYKRNAQEKPIVWSASEFAGVITMTYGLVGGNQHTESIRVTSKKCNELQSRVNAKRKEGYKELSELKDNNTFKLINPLADLYNYLNTYLPKYSTTSEGFVLPMLAKVLEDNKPFDKYGTMLGQWKINGLRCIIGAEKNGMDLFTPIHLTYHSRIGEDWTNKMFWMDDILIPRISKDLLNMMVEENVCLDGELYIPGYSVNDINSFVKNTKLPQHFKLQYWCYDICCENMSADLRNNFRLKNINHSAIISNKDWHINNTDRLIVLPTVKIDNIETAISARNHFIDIGFEGLILRNPNTEYQFGKRNQAMFKFKKIDDGKFIIVDIKSENKRKDLPLFILRNDINEELFECSINKSQDVQREILSNKEKYVGKYMFVEYRERSGIAQVPFHARGINIEN